MDLTPSDYQMISTMASFAMALVWIIYLHLVLVQYRRAHRPFLIIQHAHENDPGALCLFVNMSKEPVDLQCVMARVYKAGALLEHYVTDYDRITPDDRDVQSRLRQGPIQPGGYLVLGSFDDIILGRQTENGDPKQSGDAAQALSDIDSLELCIAVVHGPSKHHIGARRRFYIENHEGRAIIRAHSIHTEQLVAWHKRRIVRRWIEERLAPKFQGGSESRHTEQSAR